MDRMPLDYAAIRQRLESQHGPRYWRSLEQLADEPEFAAFVEAEFPGIAPEMDRRRFLQLMGASMALAGLAGCGQEPEQGVTYVKQPEHIIAGQARWFASAVPFAGYAQPVLGRTHVGRPTKLEGNPDHPVSQGAATAFTQAAILQLYDPDRSQAPKHEGHSSTWNAFQRTAIEQATRADAAQGRGLHVLLGANSSPTLHRQFAVMRERWPQAKLYRFEPWEGDAYMAAERATGRALETHYHFDRAEWVVSFEHDWLGSGPRELSQAMAWGARKRRAADGEGEARLVVVESLSTVTGAKAANRRRVEPAELHAYVRGLVAALGGGAAPTLPDDIRQWVDELAGQLQARRGRCLVTAGEYAPLDVQAAVHWINQTLGNIGKTLSYSEPVTWLEVGSERLSDLTELVAAMQAGDVETLLMLDCNPAHTAPGDLAFTDAMSRVPLRIHAGLYYDETAAHSHWHLPLTHALDGWYDSRAADGSVCLIQPLVRPFYSSRTLAEVVALMMGELSPDARALVRQTWSALDDDAWRKALELGFIQGSAFAPVEARARLPEWDEEPAGGGLSLLFRPDPSVWDGRFANLGWLQELPKPISKLTWDNVIGLSPTLAEREGIASGDRVHVTLGQHLVEGPAWIMPGQADNTLSLFGGYGRDRAGRVGDGLGYDLTPLRKAAEPWSRYGAKLTRLESHTRLASTQPHHLLHGKELIRSHPRAAAFEEVAPKAEPVTLYPPPKRGDTAWGMVIDLDQCIGCNACVVACQAENNIPVVGKEQVEMGRGMHWLRVDHYYGGDPREPTSAFQPVPCMHCDQAPCEVGCPVNATVHGPDGLNEQVYNRCIGTRTCSSYCPYKVRRFNWFDLTEDDPPSIQHQRNPNVTVRSRGVMEKCTYCVQRISEARITARIEDRDIRDGEVKTACQQTCPTQAIVFGNLEDPQAAVNRERHTRRHYALLEELNTRPKTTYLGLVEEPAALPGDAEPLQVQSARGERDG
ncbi:TAT-variant-translocated molybdopterin oxidoreductase [Stutzerimonas chloritidismutans]|uniref:TAT-variant-translocated molybdopterin oxidoreductase n=1 Tax=Stutzerimonas chloritidismutans TaxID=203192 RepID=UPI003F14B38D